MFFSRGDTTKKDQVFNVLKNLFREYDLVHATRSSSYSTREETVEVTFRFSRKQKHQHIDWFATPVEIREHLLEGRNNRVQKVEEQGKNSEGTRAV